MSDAIAARSSGELAPPRQQRLGAVEPTERSLWLLVGVFVLGAASVALESLDAAAPVALLGWALASVVDGYLARSPAGVSVVRSVPAQIRQGETAWVSWTVRADDLVRVEVTDSLPAGVDPGWLSFSATIDADMEGTHRESIELRRRGPHEFGRLAIRTVGPLGLVRRRERREHASRIDVVPDLARIGARAERLLRGRDDEGARRRRSLREGRELDSLREYARGDDVRLIEWKATARAGELIVKRLVPEARQDVMVLLDCGRHLTGQHDVQDGAAPRIDVALTSALMLSAAALAKGDRVGFMAFSADVLAFAAPAPGRGQLRKIGEVTSAARALPEEADYGGAVRFLLSRVKRRSMICIITDVLDEPSARSLAAAAVMLRGRHLPVVVAVADPATARLASGTGVTGEAGRVQLAAGRILGHRRRGLAAVKAAGAVVVDAPAGQAAAQSVQAYTELKGAGRL